MPDLPTAGGLAYREATPSTDPAAGPVVLLVHGWPESSYMWRTCLDALAAAGLRAIAPDLPGYGDSPRVRPATWAVHVKALEGFRTALGLDRVALVVHDWGGLIGLRWACEHPDAVSALVISDTGFFPDGKWHGMAEEMRTPGIGEELMAQQDRSSFGALVRSVSTGIDDAAIDEYFRALESEDGRLAQLDLYRSGNFEELAPYEGHLAGLGVPTLLLWGAEDPFAPVAGAHRLAAEIPHAELEVIAGAGHFVVEDRPDEYAAALTAFLRRETMSA